MLMSDKGDDYVAKWPSAVARKFGVSPEYVALAMVRAGVAKEGDEYALRETFRALDPKPSPLVGAITPEAAQRVIGEMRGIVQALREEAKTNCHYCGLPLRNGSCPEGCTDDF